MPFTDSDPHVTTLDIRGVWIHDPDDPEVTLRQFQFGSDQRGDSYDSNAAGTYYVGKQDPVFDFGDASADTAEFTIDVYHGPNYTENMINLRQYAAMKKTLWFRDNRSRAIFGTMSGFRTSDQSWGSSVSFTVTRAYRAVELVTV